MLEKLIVIEGTNASGKSALSVALAERFGGEVVSADSRQVYKKMDLGSGKITREEMKGVPHHLLDVRDPGEFFSMADFQHLAYEAIDGIIARGHLPILTGGTGLYIDAVADGYTLSDKRPDPLLREHLETFDTPALYEMLRSRVPDTQIDPKNRHRVMRALEKLDAGDLAEPGKEPRYEVLKFGVTWPREILKERIDERLERRLKDGMVEEVRDLLEAGVSPEFMIRLGLEYKYLTWYLTGEIGYDRMKEELGNAIKKFAKRQMTWFRRDERIIWLNMAEDPVGQASAEIEKFLGAGKKYGTGKESEKMDYPVETLLDAKFIRVFDLQYEKGKHYYEATRRKREELVAGMSDAEFEGLIPDAVSCCVVWHEDGKEDRVLLNREYRYPLGRYVSSVPAGLIDPEDRGKEREDAVFAAARRELREETGIEMTEKDGIRLLNACLFSSPGLTDEANAMVRIDLYGHDPDELRQDLACGGEKFEGFIMADRREAERIMREDRTSVFTWIGLAAFLMK